MVQLHPNYLAQAVMLRARNNSMEQQDEWVRLAGGPDCIKYTKQWHQTNKKAKKKSKYYFGRVLAYFGKA